MDYKQPKTRGTSYGAAIRFVVNQSGEMSTQAEKKGEKGGYRCPPTRRRKAFIARAQDR